VNPWGISNQPKHDPFAAFNFAQEKARREYADHPTAFADCRLCVRCQEKWREYGHRTCSRCRSKMRRGA
jgi:hypothetical protein